jgi:hypothetical protein
MAVWATGDRLTWPGGPGRPGSGSDGWTWEPPDSTGMFSAAWRDARRDRVNRPLTVSLAFGIAC